MSGDFTDLGRFTNVALLVLLSLASGEARHGYAMLEDIYTFSGTWLEPGTLYGALMRLERQGWIAPEVAEERRRPYAITPAGRDALRAGLATLRRIVSAGDARGALA
jgi:DNA-binding PadR family transcriptional regulator